MRPRTGIQRMLHAAPFPPLPLKTQMWAKRRLFGSEGVAFLQGRGGKRTRTLWCLECGHAETVSDIADAAVQYGSMRYWRCPNCRRRLTLDHRPRPANEVETSRHFAVLDIWNEWQVIRVFDARRSRATGGDARYVFSELYRIFINVRGVEHIVSRPYVRTPWHFRWCEGAWMMARHNASATGSYAYTDMYDTSSLPVAPDGRILPAILKRGLPEDCLRDPKLCRAVLKYPAAETLLKAGETVLLNEIVADGRKSRVLRYWPSVRVALRHGWKFATYSDLTLWLDYVEGLERECRDIRSPHYLCPVNLNEEHTRQIRREQTRRKAEKQKELAMLMDDGSKENMALRKRIAGIIDVAVSGGGVTIKPLTSVRQFWEEGQELHHCVFTNRYYEKDCIILGATAEGVRTATIELDLRTLEVRQCRGKRNGVSPHHEQILKLLSDNIDKFRLTSKS